MKTTKNFLAGLLENKNVLEGNVEAVVNTAFTADKIAASSFVKACSMSDLIKLGRIARAFISYYEDLSSKRSFLNKFRQFKFKNLLDFWRFVNLEISKIRTIDLLEVMVRREDVKIRRGGLTFIPDAAIEFFHSLGSTEQRNLIERVGNRFKRAAEASKASIAQNQKFSDEQIENYLESRRFWEGVYMTIASPVLAAG